MGDQIPVVNIYTHFAYETKIKRFQLIQKNPGRLTLCVEFFDMEDPSNNQSMLAAKELFESFSCSVEIIDEFRQSDEGKIVAFITELEMKFEAKNSRS